MLAGRLSKVSGELRATEASLERKGSLGFIGGMGILAFALALMEQKVVKFRDFREDEQVGVQIGICKLLAIFELQSSLCEFYGFSLRNLEMEKWECFGFC